MKTKIALEILLWSPRHPGYDPYDVSVIVYFWNAVTLGKHITAETAARKTSDRHSKLRDMALTHIANKLDKL